MSVTSTPFGADCAKEAIDAQSSSRTSPGIRMVFPPFIVD
jgi:hypothetical protein